MVSITDVQEMIRATTETIRSEVFGAIGQVNGRIDELNTKLAQFETSVTQDRQRLGSAEQTIQQYQVSTQMAIAGIEEKVNPQLVDQVKTVLNEMNDRMMKAQAQLDNLNGLMPLADAKIKEIEKLQGDTVQRIESDVNRMIQETQDKMEKIVQGSLITMEVQLKSKVQQLEDDTKTEFGNLRSDLTLEFSNHRQYMESVEPRIRALGVSGGAGTGAFTHGGRSKLTQKDVKVEKLMDKPTTSDFRQWQKLIELQLDHVHGYENMEEIIDELRRTREPITPEVWGRIMEKMHSKHPMRYNPGMGWDFETLTRFLHGYILPKLNVHLCDLTNKIQDHNGLEVIRRINNEMDYITENASTLMTLTFPQCIAYSNGQAVPCKNMKELLPVIQTIDDSAIEYKKVVGEMPSDEKLRTMLWSKLDPDTREAAQAQGVGVMESYQQMCLYIKKRILARFPGQVVMNRGKPDVVMGIASVAGQVVDSVVPSDVVENANDDSGALDAVAKGKGKGKGDPDVCIRCGGKGQHAWACATPRNSTDTRECKGCGGKGHFQNACTTVNPSLKAKGKGTTPIPKGFGKGKGFPKGKGKGKGGLYSMEPFDWMWRSESDDPNAWQSYGGDVGSFVPGGSWYTRGIGSFTRKNAFEPLSELEDEQPVRGTDVPDPDCEGDDGCRAPITRGREANREECHRKLIMGMEHIGQRESDPRIDFPGTSKAAAGPGSDPVVVQETDGEAGCEMVKHGGVRELIEHFESAGSKVVEGKKSKRRHRSAAKFGNAPPMRAEDDWSAAPLCHEIAYWPLIQNLPSAPSYKPPSPPTASHDESCECGCRCECGSELRWSSYGDSMEVLCASCDCSGSGLIDTVDFNCCDWDMLCGTCDGLSPSTTDLKREGANDVADVHRGSEIVEIKANSPGSNPIKSGSRSKTAVEPTTYNKPGEDVNTHKANRASTSSASSRWRKKKAVRFEDCEKEKPSALQTEEGRCVGVDHSDAGRKQSVIAQSRTTADSTDSR